MKKENPINQSIKEIQEELNKIAEQISRAMYSYNKYYGRKTNFKSTKRN